MCFVPFSDRFGAGGSRMARFRLDLVEVGPSLADCGIGLALSELNSRSDCVELVLCSVMFGFALPS